MRTLSSAFNAGAVSKTTSKTRRSSRNRWYCSNTSASSSNNNEKEEFEKIKSNTTNNNEEKKKTKSYSYAIVTKRTPPRKDLGTFRFADDQMACGVRVDLNESTFVISRDENVHAEIRKVRGRRETKSGGGKFREEFIEQTVRGRVQEELILKTIFYYRFLFSLSRERAARCTS